MADKEKKELSEEDYLKNHLSNLDKGKEEMNSNLNEPIQVESTRVNELQYFNFSADSLPCGKFYPIGTLMIVKEIQAYSMVDDNNFYDIVEKMNNILQSCVRIKYPDGSVSSYLDVKDQDRLFLVFLIRELTFQQGNELSIKEICEVDNKQVNIELKTKHFVFHELDEKLERFFSTSTNSFKFKLKNRKEYEVSPPNIGLQKSFSDYIIRENVDKKTPNLSFLKIVPFMLSGRTSISYDGIKSKLVEFEEMDDESFQFLNSAISKMTFGIKGLMKKCDCGSEVHAEMQFPNGASGIFVIQDAFDAFIEE